MHLGTGARTAFLLIPISCPRLAYAPATKRAPPPPPPPRPFFHPLRNLQPEPVGSLPRQASRAAPGACLLLPGAAERHPCCPLLLRYGRCCCCCCWCSRAGKQQTGMCLTRGRTSSSRARSPARTYGTQYRIRSRSSPTTTMPSGGSRRSRSVPNRTELELHRVLAPQALLAAGAPALVHVPTLKRSRVPA